MLSLCIRTAGGNFSHYSLLHLCSFRALDCSMPEHAPSLHPPWTMVPFPPMGQGLWGSLQRANFGIQHWAVHCSLCEGSMHQAANPG